MKPALVRLAGLACTAAYAGLILTVYARQPRTVQQLTSGVAAAVGAYRVDPVNFAEGLRFFHQEHFVEARAAFDRADPARQDPLTQFYVAYSFYRQGWGRLYRDEALYRQGVEAVDRAIAHSPGGRLSVPDASLGMHTADELRAELQRSGTREVSDLGHVFEARK
jgi:hypothetical protein